MKILKRHFMATSTLALILASTLASTQLQAGSARHIEDLSRGRITEEEFIASLDGHSEVVLLLNGEEVSMEEFISEITDPGRQLTTHGAGTNTGTRTLTLRAATRVHTSIVFAEQRAEEVAAFLEKNPMSRIQLPNRRLTDEERQEWIEEYWEMGGPGYVELEIFRVLNEVRLEHGLQPVIWDNALGMAARFYTQQKSQLNLNLGHNSGPYGTGEPGTNASVFGQGASAQVAKAFGANLGRMSAGNAGSRSSFRRTAEQHVEGWMNSPGHRRVMLLHDALYVGAGISTMDNIHGSGSAYLFFSAVPQDNN